MARGVKKYKEYVEYGYGRKVDIGDEYGNSVSFLISNTIARELLWICRDILRDELNVPNPTSQKDTSAIFETLEGMKGLRA